MARWFLFFQQECALRGGGSVESCQVPVEAGDAAGSVSTAHMHSASEWDDAPHWSDTFRS